MRKILLVALVLVLPACSGGDDSSSDGVTMTDAQTFEPDRYTVSAGDTVTWTNESSESHTVTAYEEEVPDGGDYFSSGGASSEEEARDDLEEALIDEGGNFEFTFEEPGTYTYFCIPHENQGMVATIVVEE